MRHIVFLWVVLFSGLVSAKDFTLTLNAGKLERDNLPVTFSLTPDKAYANPVVRLFDGDRELPIQWKQEGSTFACALLLEHLGVGETKTFRVTLDESQEKTANPAFHWSGSALFYGGNLELEIKNQPYNPKNRADNFKVFHHVYLNGKRLTKGPGGLYPHHRGLFFGFNKISYGENGHVDIWHCSGDTHQRFEKFLTRDAGDIFARETSLLSWNRNVSETFATEERTLTVWRSCADGFFVDFSTSLKPTDWDLRLDGDPQHAGFHFRADQEVAEKTAKETLYLRPWGTGQPGETVNWKGVPEQTTNQTWKACSFVLDGKRYSVVYLTSPANPGETRWSERNYGRFGHYFEYDLKKGSELRLNYRLWIQPGLVRREFCESLYQNFNQPVEVSVR
ncbi:MAG: PmoA family protein [Planctomycetia bacterium]|nr:PmoA family protein [Planctomycetia bacterium]